VKRRRQPASPRKAPRELPHEIKKDKPALKMFLVPCSCGTTFAVAENYDRQGTAWGRYLPCPTCGKRHDPKNRLLQMGYQRDGFWKVDEC
jgi:hypothetical protein